MKCPSRHHLFVLPRSQCLSSSREILRGNLQNSLVEDFPLVFSAEKGNRKRRQIGSSLDVAALCPGGMDLNTAYQICSEPKSKCKTRLSCSKTARCGLARRRRSWWGFSFSHRSRCWDKHITRRVTECCEYFCENVENSTTIVILEGM